jgi:protein TonB
VHGIVKVGYVVNEDSTLSNFFIRRGVSKDLNNEALRLAKMIPKFIPGMIADQKVKVLMQVSIDFDIKMYERARFRANQQPGNHSYVPTKF